MSIKVKNLPVELTPAMTDSTINDTLNTTTKKTTWQKIYDMFVAFFNTGSSGYAAAGTNQATATALTHEFCRIDTVAAGTGVKDSVAAVPKFKRTVQNNGANALKYYPFGTNQFFEIGTGLLGASVPVIINPGSQVSVYSYNADEETFI